MNCIDEYEAECAAEQAERIKYEDEKWSLMSEGQKKKVNEDRLLFLESFNRDCSSDEEE